VNPSTLTHGEDGISITQLAGMDNRSSRRADRDHSQLSSCRGVDRDYRAKPFCRHPERV
jgi:hypothetical protein